MHPGFATCTASNKNNKSEDTGEILLGDFSEAFTVTGLNQNDVIAVGDSIELLCAATVYNYSSKIEWLKNDEVIQDEQDDFKIENIEGKFSHQSRLSKKELSRDDSGSYSCKVYSKNSSETFDKFVDLEVHDTVEPYFDTSFNASELNFMMGEPMRLVCKASGIPHPTILWFMVGFLFHFSV